MSARLFYLSSSCTCCHQPVLSSFLLKPVCHCSDQPAAGGTEWMTQGQRSSPQVKLLHGRCSHLHARALQFVRRAMLRQLLSYSSDTFGCYSFINCQSITASELCKEMKTERLHSLMKQGGKKLIRSIMNSLTISV